MTAPRRTMALSALALALAGQPATAEAPPGLLAALTACTTPDVTLADRTAALDAAGALPLDGDARLQAARAMQVGWRLLNRVAAGDVTPADLPALFANADADAAREAALAADGVAITALEWRSLDGGTVQVQLFQFLPRRASCAITGPAVDLADLAATWPPVEGITSRDGPLGATTALQAVPGKRSLFIEVYQPDAAPIAAAWPGPVPASFFLISNLPTAPAP